MSTLYIEEYTTYPYPAPPAPVVKQKVTVGASTTQSSAFGATTRCIIVTADVPSQIELGANPTAAASSGYLPFDQPRAYTVSPGDKIAVIAQQ